MKKVILYGAGTQNLRMAFQPIVSAGYEVFAIVDKDRQKQGKDFYGVEINAPEIIKSIKENADDYQIVVTIRTEETVLEVKEYLKQITSIRVYSFSEFIENEKLNSKIKRFSCVMFHLVDHCNMSCVRCSHFSPLAKKNGYYLSLDEFERDIKRLKILTNGDIDEIQLSGGEPLLHPQVHIFPYIVHKYFPDTQIIIITNSIKIKDMGRDFFDSCRANKVNIWISRYPIGLDYGAIMKRLEEEEIYAIFGNSGNSDNKPKEMWGLPMKLDGGLDGRKNFDCCLCMQYILRNGIMYPCANSAYIDLFNEYFDKKLPGPQVNGVDIYKVRNMEELAREISRPVPLCDYCDAKHRKSGIPWCVSKKDIEEWTI